MTIEKTDAEVWAELDKEFTGENPPQSVEDDGGEAKALEAETPTETTSEEPAVSGDTPAISEPQTPSLETDPWEKAPAELRELYQKEVEELKKRISGQDRKIRELNTPKIVTPPKKQEVATPPAEFNLKELAEWTTFEEEFPDVATPIAKALQKLVQTHLTPVAQKTVELETRAANNDQQEILKSYAMNEAYIKELHPDIDTVAATKEFGEWVVSQPKFVQEAVHRNANTIVDVTEADTILKMYKAFSGKREETGAPVTHNLSEKRSRQLESAAARPSKATAPITSGVPQEGDAKAIWEAWDKQPEFGGRR